MKVTVNKETCIGCGACVAICPAVFELKEGKSSVKKQPSNEKEENCVKEAVEACPVDAIKTS